MFKFIKKGIGISLNINCKFFKMYFIKKSREREVILNNKYLIYPYSIKVNRCNGNCNNIKNPYSKVCIPNTTKNFTLKIFDLMT